MKIIRIILNVIVIVFAAYVLFIEDFTLMPYVMLTMGIFMLVAGFEKIQKDRKEFWGYMFVIVSIFIFFVSAQGFIVNA
ncbi:hypothetical protein DP119_02705 [Planococcus maitriensis]|uniref:DUF3953 domain-containing protein n=2 Tax=Planococcus maitriensis TaxID=221799 RepID=A0A365K9Z4_9BACL|nr:hypothetical protein DP119_02705 [Planococcus maitriensis]